MHVLEALAELQKGRVAPLYLLHGEEEYLIRKFLQQIHRVVLPDGVPDFDYNVLDGSRMTPGEVVAQGATMPFMAERRLVVIKGIRFLAAKRGMAEQQDEQSAAEDDGERELLEYLLRPNPACVMVLAADGKVDTRRKLVKAMIKVGQEVSAVPLKGPALVEWLKGRWGEVGKKITPEALEYMIIATGGSMTALDAEVDKICTYLGEETNVNLPVVRRLVPRNAEVGIFEMVDAMANRQTAQAIDLLREMMRAGEQPVYLNLMLARQVRLMLMAKGLLARGVREGDLGSYLRVHPFAAKRAGAQSRNFTAQALVEALKDFLMVDERLKSGAGDPAVQVELAVIKFCL